MTAVETGQRYVITELERDGVPVLHAHSADQDRDWIASARQDVDGRWFVMLGIDAARTAGYVTNDVGGYPPVLEALDGAQARAALEMFARLYFAQPAESGTSQ